MRLSIRSWVTEWKGLPLLLLAKKQSRTVGIGSGSGPRCQDTILGDVDAQTRFEITSKQSIDPPLLRGYTLGSGEDNMKLIGIDGILLKLVLPVFVSAVKHMLMLPVQVSAAEEIIDFLKASSIHYASTVNPVIYTSCIEQFWATAKDAQAKEIAALKKRIQRLERRKMSRPTGLKRLSKGRSIEDIDADVDVSLKNQIALDEQIARDIQAKLDAELLEEQKLARKQEEEANIALIKSWENTQAIMEADRLLAERLQSKEREELKRDEEKAKLFYRIDGEEKEESILACSQSIEEKKTDLLPRHKRELNVNLSLSHIGGLYIKTTKRKEF
ncbi:hypothetical protein Tco_0923850 [Tanacetum coccineum]|uniref:Uncharacterized protein n=1 Tax=Tanacetum coccineum TaxID=301880 RepID=A0ABQ5D286_9ASTR